LRGASLASRHFIVALAVAYLVTLAALLPVRAWDPDEFQHMQFAWMLWQGMAPYKDFFEHHTPLLHLMTAPLFGVFHTPYDYVHVIPVLLRFISTLFSLLTTGVVWLLADRLGGRRAALFATMLMLGASTFLSNGIEFRPDTLAALTMMAAVYAAIRAADTARGSEASPLRLAFAGVALAASIMSTQKELFAGPGLLAAFAVIMVPRFGPARALRSAGWTMAGAVLVIVPILAFFAVHDALWDFFRSNFVTNAIWPRSSLHLARWRVEEFLQDDPIFAALSFAGSILLLKRWWTGDTMVSAIVLPMASLAIGFPVLPSPQQQYLFLIIPFAAIPAGIAADAVADLASRHLAARISNAAVIMVPVAVAALNLDDALHRPDQAKTLAKLEYIVRQTPANATVMGGWSPGLAFRKPAFFYWFLHSEIRAQVPPAAWRDLDEGLRSGSVRPEVVDLDGDLQQLPPDIVAYFRSAYAPTGIGTLWRRRP